ncbi:MAG: hypothetical protein ACYTGN_12785 [Planctomycetota bacterium]|jgi:hypothetical protein
MPAACSDDRPHACSPVAWRPRENGTFCSSGQRSMTVAGLRERKRR